MGRQSQSATRGLRNSGCQPRRGLNSPPCRCSTPFRVRSSIGHSHGFRLVRHPWLLKLIPYGDAMKLGAKYVIEFARRSTKFLTQLDVVDF